MTTSNADMSTIRDMVKFLEPYNVTLKNVQYNYGVTNYECSTTYEIQIPELGLLQLKNDLQLYNTASTAIMLMRNVMDKLP